MIAKPIPHGVNLAQGAAGYVRGEGLHMSDLYSALYKDLEPERYDTGSPMDLQRVELGLAFEEMLERAFKDRLFERPGEFQTDEGIIFSPDLLIFEDDIIRVGEIKLSWLSSKDTPRDVNGSFGPKFDKWMVQIKAYCYHLETPYARLYFFAVNGDYKPPSPQLLAWDLTFTPRELEENWRMLRNYAVRKGILNGD